MKNPWLESLTGRLDAVNAEVRGWAETHSEEALARPPASGGWSALECLEHVAVTAHLYLRAAAPAVAKAHELHDAASFEPRHTLAGKLELFAVKPDSRLKFKAPGSMKPQGKVDASAIEHALAAHKELHDLMLLADGLDINRARFPNPVFKFIRQNVTDGFLVLTLHAERHAAQARLALPAGQ